MRRPLLAGAAFLLTLIVVSCRDTNRDGAMSTGPRTPEGASFSVAPGTCTTLANLTSLVNQVFSYGGPNANSVLGKLNNLDKQLKKGKLAEAQDQARNTIDFIQKKAADGSLQAPPAMIQALINGILCYAGLADDTFLVFPSAVTQVITNSSPAGTAGAQLPPGAITTPTLITVTFLPPTGPSPLNTKLDKYPAYVVLSSSSPLAAPAVVGVCPSTSVPAAVLARLRLGHQGSAGFEITPPADASFLNCPSSLVQSRAPGWLKALASLVLPRPLYAKMRAGGGVGGVATEFSPFGPVDPELRVSGGVGGTSTEFNRSPLGGSVNPFAPRKSPAAPSFTLTPGNASFTVVGGVCTAVEATVGSALEPQCRPGVTLKTFQGTVMQNVPVSWAVALGGGVVAPETPVSLACGTFGSTVATTTSTLGKAGVCWSVGATTGTNTVVATPSAGGDAPAGVTFSPANKTFTATALPIRVAGVGANLGNLAGNAVFSSGDLPGTITRLTEAQFNALTPAELRAAYDVLLVTWATSPSLNVDWNTRLLPYLQAGGGVVYDGDPNNIGDLAAIVSTQVLSLGGESASGISVTTAVAGLTDGINSFFDNNHIEFATFDSWSLGLSPFLSFTSGLHPGAVVGLRGRFGAGCIVLTGPDQDYHGSRGGNANQSNQYNLLVNEIRFVRRCP